MPRASRGSLAREGSPDSESPRADDSRCHWPAGLVERRGIVRVAGDFVLPPQSDPHARSTVGCSSCRELATEPKRKARRMPGAQQERAVERSCEHQETMRDGVSQPLGEAVMEGEVFLAWCAKSTGIRYHVPPQFRHLKLSTDAPFPAKPRQVYPTTC